MSKKPTRFTRPLATKILDEIRLGLTLTELAKQAWCPTVLTVYDWLADSKLTTLKALTFNQAYEQAMIDRGRSWSDMSATAFDDLKLNGSSGDSIKLKVANDKARMLKDLSHAERIRAKQAVTAAAATETDAGITVEITVFKPKEDD